MFEYIPRVNQTSGHALGPVLDVLYKKWHLTPNKISAIAFLIGTGGVVAILAGQIGLAMILVLLALLFDAFDGSVARRFGLASRFGEYLDNTLDRTNEAMLILALAAVGKIDFELAFLAIAATLLMTSVKFKSQFDPGFKRIMILAGYLIGFEVAVTVTFLANLAGFVVSVIMIDLREQIARDAKR